MEPVYLNTPEYTIEVWDINGVMVMDISDLISTSLRISREINVVEDINFTIDLVQFENRCAAVGANPRSIIEPYRTDIKIRRNGEYLCGGQVVQANINFNQQDTNKIEVKCTGYLNYFKDRYISSTYRNKTYAGIAQQLIVDTQAQPNLVSNSHFYDDIGGWVVSDAGYVAWDSVQGHDYPGSLFASVTTGTNTYGGARWVTGLIAGASYTLTFWMKTAANGGTVFLVRGNGTRYAEAAITNTAWTQYSYTWTQPVSGSYLDIKTDGSINFFIDDVTLTCSLDNPAYFNFGVTLGVDTASPVQAATRIRTYDLQNVKDGISNLTVLENDNFDFEFTANKVFNVYNRLGSDRPDIELVYPQNITSVQVNRDASTLANRIIGLGSGIGSERLETIATSYNSAAVYRVRERTETFNSVQEQATLDENTFGKLAVYQDIYEVPSITVEANHLDINDVKLGDAIVVRIDNSSFVKSVNGMYRIVKMDINVNVDMEESISLGMVVW